MNWGIMGASYAMLHAVHGIADYWFQTDWQAQNKSKRLDALARHCTVYGLSFLSVGFVLHQWAGLPTWKMLALPFVIALPHAWMDKRAFLNWFLRTTKGWTADQMATLPAPAVAVRTHVAIHMDQKFHYLCLAFTAAWLACN